MRSDRRSGRRFRKERSKRASQLSFLRNILSMRSVIRKPDTAFTVAAVTAMKPSVLLSVVAPASPVIAIAPTRTTAAIALVSDISGECSSGDTRLISWKPRKAASMNTNSRSVVEDDAWCIKTPPFFLLAQKPFADDCSGLGQSDGLRDFVLVRQHGAALFLVPERGKEIVEIARVKRRSIRREARWHIAVGHDEHAVPLGHLIGNGTFHVAALLDRQVNDHAARLHRSDLRIADQA